MTRGSNVTRETLMVLKRFMMMALGTLGMGALFVRTASADIPAPDASSDAATCIMQQNPPMGRGVSSGGGTPTVSPNILEEDTNPPLGTPFMVIGKDCATSDLATRIGQAADQFVLLNPASDDYADDLAELRAEFSGPILDAVFDESLAQSVAAKVLSDYVAAQEKCNRH